MNCPNCGSDQVNLQCSNHIVYDPLAVRVVRDLNAENATLRAELERLQGALLKWEEREAAVCPEDVGFEEVIQHSVSEIERLSAEVARLTGERDALSDVINKNGAAAVKAGLEFVSLSTDKGFEFRNARAETAETDLSQAQQALRQVREVFELRGVNTLSRLGKIADIMSKAEAALLSDTQGAQAQFEVGQRVWVNHPRYQGFGKFQYEKPRVIGVLLGNGNTWEYEYETVKLA